MKRKQIMKFIHSAECNEGRRPKFWQYHRGRLSDPHNGTTHWSPSDMAEALRYCAELLEGDSDYFELADVAAFLQNAPNYMPKVKAWCVVKHYRDHDPETGQWSPAVWVGFTNQAQAEQFAPVIQAHYDAAAPGGKGWGDKFLVEFTECAIQRVVQPWLAPREYVRRLR